MKQRIFSGLIYGLSSAIGIIAFLYPFFMPVVMQSQALGQAHSGDAPLMLTILVALSFIALVFEIQGQAIGAKVIALLGVLVAMNAILRFIEVAIPGPGGFSPIFVLIILCGYVYGGRFGFQMGVLTLIVSALITGGVGPWLPYQMLTAGWVGLSAPLCRPFIHLFGEGGWAEIAILALFGAGWGIMYGIIINVWFWPFMTGPAEQSWIPGMGVVDSVQRYAVFYVVTSLFWDAFRGFGNAALIVAFGLPTLRALRRFRQRFDFEYHPA
jgi:energy-coupling factor transport system substrate-specific component